MKPFNVLYQLHLYFLFFLHFSVTDSFQNSLKIRIKLHKIVYTMSKNCLRGVGGVEDKRGGGKTWEWGDNAMVVGDRRPWLEWMWRVWERWADCWFVASRRCSFIDIETWTLNIVCCQGQLRLLGIDEFDSVTNDSRLLRCICYLLSCLSVSGSHVTSHALVWHRKTSNRSPRLLLEHFTSFPGFTLLSMYLVILILWHNQAVLS